MPAAIVTRLNTEINKLLANPDLRDRLSSEALEPMPMTPEEFGKYMRDDIDKWSRLAKARHIEIND
jgi:tripartite-type tricarboxylate transporter receptor subunit TctC